MHKCADTSYCEIQFSLFDNFATFIHLGCTLPTRVCVDCDWKLSDMDHNLGWGSMNLLALALIEPIKGSKMIPGSFPSKCFKNEENHPSITLKGKWSSKGEHQRIWKCQSLLPWSVGHMAQEPQLACQAECLYNIIARSQEIIIPYNTRFSILAWEKKRSVKYDFHITISLEIFIAVCA